MPVECGGVYADEGETKNFVHQDEDDKYKIRLKGKANGGSVYCAIYMLYERKYPIPRSFGEFLAAPFVDQTRTEESFITGINLDVKDGEEKEVGHTGLYATGS